jgi:hypothetical protein
MNPQPRTADLWEEFTRIVEAAWQEWQPVAHDPEPPQVQDPEPIRPPAVTGQCTPARRVLTAPWKPDEPEAHYVVGWNGKVVRHEDPDYDYRES